MIDFGRDQTIEVGGREFRLNKLRIRHLRDWKRYVLVQEGDPFALPERFAGKISEDHLVLMLAEAKEKAKALAALTIWSELSIKHLLTEEGVYRITRALTEEHHPDISEDDLLDVASYLADNLVETINKASGVLPNGAGAEAAAPNQPTGESCTVAACTAQDSPPG